MGLTRQALTAVYIFAMPLIVEDDLAKAGATGFDLQSASTLFWKPVPVVLRHSDREDQSDELTFRILTGFARHNHNLRILRIHISSDSDLFFLHSLEVSEEDFQSLKNEQGILVDFASFPGKIITLLDRCTSQQQQADATRFQAVLTVRGVETVFKIVEINDFKQLPHITLAFRSGNDASVKQFLAFRLLEVRSNCQELTSELQTTKGDLSSTRAQLSSCQQQLAEVKEQYSRHMLEVEADFKTQRAAAQEESLLDRAAVKDQFDRERQELERKYREQIEALDTKVAQLDTDGRRLREAKYELDSKVSELSHKLASAEGSNRSLEEEATRLKQLNQQLSNDKHDRDIQLNEARAKVISLEEKIQAQQEIIEEQRSRVRELETSARQLEGRCNDLRDVAASNDQRAKEAQSEVVKGNHIIERLMNDVKLGKEKVRRKHAIVLRQEEELQQREQALANALRELQSMTQAIESARAEAASSASENSELRAKLEESKNQLQSNEQMIRWLNQQVTDAQLQGAGTAPGSRYAFRHIAGTPGGAMAALPSTSGGAGLSAATPATRLLAAPGLSFTAAKHPGSSADMGRAPGPGPVSSYGSSLGGASVPGTRTGGGVGGYGAGVGGSMGGGVSAYKAFASTSPPRVPQEGTFGHGGFREASDARAGAHAPSVHSYATPHPVQPRVGLQ